MKIYLSYRERFAGFFMLFTLLGVIAFIVGAAIENRWLEPRVPYHTHVVRGDGLRTGSPVLLSGIDVGEVGDLVIMEDNRIDVEILVRERHTHRVRVGTTAEVRRLLGIGEKRIHLVSGKRVGEPFPPHALLPANEPMDILDAVANIDLGKYVNTVDRAVAAMEVMLGKLEEENRLVRMMEAFDQMGPTMERVNKLFTELHEPLVELFNDKSVRKTFKGADKLFNDPSTRKAMGAIAKTFEPSRMKSILERFDRVINRFDKLLADEGHFHGAVEGADKLLNDGRMDRMLTAMEQLTDAEKLEKLVDNMAIVANQMAKIGPKIPTMTTEMINALREVVIVFKALQKTWLLDEEAEEVLKELRKK
ncbi:MAG: MCE family protein [Proteobacteria bacterium]|nr:MCE family protein [Pseudomonadota bacterium]